MRGGFVNARAYLEGRVELGDEVVIEAFATIIGPVSIGAGTHVYSGAVIGGPGEHRTAKSEGYIRIGEHCEIREHVAIQRGTGERETTVGDRVLAMHGSHVGHDSVVGDDCTISPNAVLGGHTRMHTGASLGIGAMTHQRTTLGAFSFCGMGAVVTRDVPPFALVMGNPARFARWNQKALDAWGANPGDVFIDGFEMQTIRIGIQAMIDAFRADSRRPEVRIWEVPS